jgi:putative transposase
MRILLSEKVVRRLMKQENLIAATPKRRRYGSYLGEISPAPENLINRDFRSAAPNQKWLTDITEFQIPAGKVYLSPIIHCFDGLVVSWSLGTTPDAELVNTMLDTAIETVATGPDRPIVHSDRGATIDGRAGCLELIVRVLFAQCPARPAHPTMLHVRASSVV